MNENIKSEESDTFMEEEDPLHEKMKHEDIEEDFDVDHVKIQPIEHQVRFIF